VGISRGGARFLLAEASQWPFSGRVLQLGRQHLFFGREELENLASFHGVKLKDDFVGKNVREPLLDEHYLDDGTFFSLLGCSDVESLDLSNDEKPTYTHDLNQEVPDQLKNRFDAIYDGGTIEHIFDVRSVFRNIFEMLRVGGRIIHQSPSSNHVDHGFYMFSPTLFVDYYSTNNFTIHESQVFEYSVDHNSQPWMVYDYDPGCLDHLSFGGMGEKGKLLALYICAEKTTESSWDKIPQQGMYARKWKDKNLKHEAIKRLRNKPQWEGKTSPPQRPWLDKILRRKPMTIDKSPIPNKVAEY
jgi:hypothetical protein